MLPFLPASNQQCPINPDGKPYDVAMLFDNVKLVGFEFKVRDGAALTSWSARQHQAYLALTNHPRLRLPIFYIYNIESLGWLADIYNESWYELFLQHTRISLPRELPGKFPATGNHISVSEWLGRFLSTAGDGLGGDWAPILVENADLLTSISDAFSGVVWLLVAAHGGVHISWALTNNELREHVKNFGVEWRERHLERVGDAAVSAAYADVISKLCHYLDELRADARNQYNSEETMDDRPCSSGPSM